MLCDLCENELCLDSSSSDPRDKNRRSVPDPPIKVQIETK